MTRRVGPAAIAAVAKTGGVIHTMYDLTAFQRDCLRAIAILGEPYGLAIKEWLEHEAEYQDVNHGRLYPNLDTLVKRGFIEKNRGGDDRTNEYRLTRRGKREVSRWFSQWGRAAEAVEDKPLTDGGTSIPDARETALEVDPGPDDGVGVQHDELMDAAIDASNAARGLADMDVELDTLLDDIGLFPDEMHTDLRRAQQTVRRWAEWSDAFADELRERQAEVHEAL